MECYLKKLVAACTIRTFEPNPDPPKTQFRVYGIVYNKNFQKCRAYVEMLHENLPEEHLRPDIRAMLDVEWASLITKLKRKGCGSKIWSLKEEVVVFLNNECLGDDTDFFLYVEKNYEMHLERNFEQLAHQNFINHLVKQSDIGRDLVYFTIAIDEHVVGSLVFKIYSDLVPDVCESFLKRVVRKSRSYAGTPIHRIAKPSWIQCGGWEMKNHTVACENYAVPHDRRGVLSMCNNGKHRDNSTQFFITLDSTPWMDHKYVAFGQLIQGENILQLIENIPTEYEKPLRKIEICKTNELSVCSKQGEKGEVYREKLLSEIMKTNYNKSDYCLHLPILNLPDCTLYKYLRQLERVESDEGEEMSPTTSCKDSIRTEPYMTNNFSSLKCVKNCQCFFQDHYCEKEHFLSILTDQRWRQRHPRLKRRRVKEGRLNRLRPKRMRLKGRRSN